MIEIFETCQTKSIAKQTNRDESLIIRSILSHVWSRDLIRQWPAVHNQNKQGFLNETFKAR